MRCIFSLDDYVDNMRSMTDQGPSHSSEDDLDDDGTLSSSSLIDLNADLCHLAVSLSDLGPELSNVVPLASPGELRDRSSLAEVALTTILVLRSLLHPCRNPFLGWTD